MAGPIDWAERGLVPDSLIRQGIRRLLASRLAMERLADADAQDALFRRRIAELAEGDVAVHTDAANEQHYEVPAAFFRLCLGRHRKYSCGYWDETTRSLDDSEAAMLALTVERARLEDGQRILELGCGWGSLSLWMAEHLPRAEILCVSNSSSQRETILGLAAERGLDNIDVVTADMRDFDPGTTFDRIVSVEMFEHMSNYRELMRRIGTWLRPGGRLFVHHFCHRELLYPFQVDGGNDWMARHFFTGGIMPSADTLLFFQDDLRLEQRWLVDGRHYEKTCNAWLARLDGHRAEALEILGGDLSAREAGIWLQRWRIFYMACAELFGYGGGREWLVGHYRFRRPE
ncbi:MAG: cyclopropane-fatty-acyl-phospholipid synthase [Gammaproteobacteria bacterium]